MGRLGSLITLGVGVAAGVASSYWYVNRLEPIAMPAAAEQATPAAAAEPRVLYYRNPMGLPDTSPVPKKDAMGMDYIPVFADEQDDGTTVKVSLDKVQRSGVKTEKVEARQTHPRRPCAGDGGSRRVAADHRDGSSDGYIEDLYVDKTGQHVKAGEPLFRFYSPQIQLAQVDLIVADARARPSSTSNKDLEGAMPEIAEPRCPRGPHRRSPQDERQPEDAGLAFAGNRRRRSKRKSSRASASWPATSCSVSPIILASG